MSDAEVITSYLTLKENADKLVIEIRKKTGAEIISYVKSVLRDVFDKTDIPDKENELYDFSHTIINDELMAIEQISGKYADEVRYPGKESIGNYIVFLKGILNVTDPSSFLSKISEEKDELITQRHMIEPVASFFGSVQVEIFRRLSKKIENFKRNAMFLGEDAQSDVGEIEEILGLDEPYSRIKLLPQLEGRIEGSLQHSLSALKQDVQTKLRSVKEDLERELAAGDSFTDEFKRSISDIFNDVEKNTAGSDDCAFVKLQSTRIDELNGSACESIEQEKQTIRETGDDNGNGNGKAVKVIRAGSLFKTKKNLETEDNGKAVKVIRAGSLFKTKKNLETEEDLVEYLENLKPSIREILKEHMIRVM